MSKGSHDNVSARAIADPGHMIALAFASVLVVPALTAGRMARAGTLSHLPRGVPLLKPYSRTRRADSLSCRSPHYVDGRQTGVAHDRDRARFRFGRAVTRRPRRAAADVRAGAITWLERSRMPPSLPSISATLQVNTMDLATSLHPDGKPEHHACSDLAPVGR
jgi:hypothetical protein